MEPLDEVLGELDKIEDAEERSFLQRLFSELFKDSKAIDRAVEDAMREVSRALGLLGELRRDVEEVVRRVERELR